jgi:hypothetical protein
MFANTGVLHFVFALREEARLLLTMAPKKKNLFQTDTFGVRLEQVKTIISVLWQAGRMVHAWGGNPSALTS